MTLNGAYAECRKIAFGHYENFPVASRLIPREYRDDLAALYAFMRTADDVADGDAGVPANKRDAWLRARGTALVRAVRGKACDESVLLACAATVRHRRLDVALLLDLLQAFRLDQRKKRYGTLLALLGAYCRYSANPVGRLVLQLFGHRDAALYALSDKICSALQLTNFWQDVGKDARMGRVYLPQDRMRAHGVRAPDLLAPVATPGVRALVLEMCEKTNRMFEEGSILSSRVSRGLRWQLRATIAGGQRVLAKIRAARGDTLSASQRVRLTRWDALPIGNLLVHNFLLHNSTVDRR